jgi:hypothetical protein
MSVIAALALTAALAADVPPATPSPSPSPVAQGPCGQGGVATVADRPGLGRALTVNGSPCVVPLGVVVGEFGFRQQTTRAAAGVSTLATFPQPLLRWGLAAGDELVVAPSFVYSQRSGQNLGTAPFMPAAGLQDAGLGFKRQLTDQPGLQSALEAFVTFPTGYPGGANGFSAGLPTYLAGYSLTLPLNAVVSLSTTQNVGWTGYFAYQPSLGVSLAAGARTVLLLQDQITVPAGAGGGSSNRSLLGVQQTLSANVVVDLEYEANLLPQPGFTQHAFGGGVAVRW